MDETANRQERRNRLNTRKKALTAESSARWANAIIAGNVAQYRLARDAQHRHIIGLYAVNPPTAAHGEASTGARRMRTSPDTRQPPL
jgi:hypothetical protein